MKKEEVQHLANLARLELTDAEVEQYTKEFGGILEYVHSVNEVSSSLDASRIESVSVRNVFREDGPAHQSGEYTDDILKEAPDTQDGFVKVKKIL